MKMNQKLLMVSLSSVFHDGRVNTYIQKLKEIIFNFCNDSSFQSDIFSKDGILKIVEDHYQHKNNFEYILSVLLTYITTYNLFILNSYNKPPSLVQPLSINKFSL